MNNPLLNGLVDNGYQVDMYDLSIEDVQERREKKVRFDTAMAAGNFLGITPKHIYRNIGVGKYAIHRETGKRYALRRVVTK